MYFALDPDQLTLRDAVLAFADRASTEEIVRESMTAPDGFDAAAWKQLALDLGVVTLGSGSAAGGAGGSFADAAIVVEVLSGALYPGPYLSSVVATQALCAVAAKDPAAGLLSVLACGADRVVTVLPRARGDWLRVDGEARTGETVTGETLTGETVTGEFAAVPEAYGADRLLVCGADTDWYEVAASAKGLACVAVAGFDQTRRLARVTLSGTAARRVALTAAPAQVRERVVVAEQIAVAAESVGVARHALEAGVEYAKRREQFGRPIGSFQALQHWFADTALAVECAWSAAYSAAWEFDHRPATVQRSAALALATAGDAALAAAEQLLQVHGGVGFTWDNPAHLYLKRAKSNRLLWGHPDEHRRRLGELLGL